MYWFDKIFACIPTALGKEKRTQRQLAKWQNEVALQNIFSRLVERALSRYDIEGYPETVNGRVLRMSLLFHGSVGFFEREGNVLALPALPNANVTLYGDFKSMWVYGRNGFNEEIPIYVPGGADSKLVNEGVGSVNLGKNPRGVWIRENMQAYPFINYCIEYAEKIADAYRVLDINRHHLKIPYIIVAEEQVIPTVKAAMDALDDNVNYIVSSGIFPVDKVNVIDTPTGPDTLKATTDLIEWYYNDFDRLCGKNSNSNPDKAERLLVDEVNANNESTESDKANFLDYLQEQLDFVNEMMGTAMRVVELKGDDENDDDVSGLDSDTGPDKMGTTAGSD